MTVRAPWLRLASFVCQLSSPLFQSYPTAVVEYCLYFKSQFPDRHLQLRPAVDGLACVLNACGAQWVVLAAVLNACFPDCCMAFWIHDLQVFLPSETGVTKGPKQVRNMSETVQAKIFIYTLYLSIFLFYVSIHLTYIQVSIYFLICLYLSDACFSRRQCLNSECCQLSGPFPDLRAIVWLAFSMLVFGPMP